LKHGHTWHPNLVARTDGYFINEKLIDTIFSNPKIFKKIPVLLKYFMELGQKNHKNEEHYFLGNGGHPNIEACEIWSDVLKDYIEELFGKSE